MPDHFQLQTGSPIYCLEWLAEDVLVYAGGGGKGRSGVGNYMRVLHVPRTAKAPTDVDVLAELKLSSEEDAPMSMAIEPRTNSIVLGINEADDEKLQGNEHLRIYQCDIVRNSDAKPTATLTAQSSAPSLPLKDAAESYLRLLAFSPAGDQLVSASTDGRYALHDWPSLKPVFQSTDDFVGQEIVDADFSQDGNQLVLCTGSKLKVFGTFPNPAASPTSSSSPSSSSAGGDYVTVSKTEATLAINQSLSLGPKSSLDDVKATHAAKSTADAAAPLTKPPTWQTIQNPALGGEGGCEFRAVRFGKPAEQPAKAAATEPPSEKDEKPPPATSTTPPSSPSSRSLFTVVNAKASAATGKGTKAKRKACVSVVRRVVSYRNLTFAPSSQVPDVVEITLDVPRTHPSIVGKTNHNVRPLRTRFTPRVRLKRPQRRNRRCPIPPRGSQDSQCARVPGHEGRMEPAWDKVQQRR